MGEITRTAHVVIHERYRDEGEGSPRAAPTGPASVPSGTLSGKPLGDLGEDLAADHLEGKGYEIVARKYRCREGEADIVAYDPGSDVVVLVEVKTRRRGPGPRDAYAEEAVTPRKRRRYRRIAACFLMDNFPTPAIRFDAVGVEVLADGTAEVHHIPGAFDWEAPL